MERTCSVAQYRNSCGFGKGVLNLENKPSSKANQVPELYRASILARLGVTARILTDKTGKCAFSELCCILIRRCWVQRDLYCVEGKPVGVVIQADFVRDWGSKTEIERPAPVPVTHSSLDN